MGWRIAAVTCVVLSAVLQPGAAGAQPAGTPVSGSEPSAAAPERSAPSLVRPDPAGTTSDQVAPAPPSEITFTARLAQQGSEARSVMLFHNSGSGAGTITVTVRDRGTGAQLGQWVSPSVPPGATLQFDPRDLNGSVPGNFIPADLYPVSVQTAMTGSFQHLLFRPSTATLTNLTTCDTGVSTDPTRLIGVHASRPNDPVRNRIVVHNTGPITANATLTIYDANDGLKLGTYHIAGIPPNGLVIKTVAEIEATAQITAVPGRSLYVVRANPGLPGFLQYIVGIPNGFATDLTLKCALNAFPPVAAPPATRIGLHSTLRDNARSILRFHNSGGPDNATVTVDLRDEITGAFLSSWTSPPIPLGAQREFPIGAIEAGATPSPFTVPVHYSAVIRSGFQGSLQHLILDRTDGNLSNFSTCAAGTATEAARLAGLTSSLAPDHVSVVVVHNLGAAATAVALDVHDAATGAYAGTYTTASIPPRGLVAVPVAALEAGALIFPVAGQRWIVRASGAFTGFLQHLLYNVQADAHTDLTALCALAVSPTATAASYYVSPSGDDSWSGTLAEPNAAGTDGPFLTFGRAQAAVAALPKTAPPDIVVQLRAGRYFQSPNVLLQAADSGTATTRVIYRNYPGETPVISGGKRVEGWVNVSGNRWEATLAADTVNFESLFYNDARRLRPRLGGGALGTYLRVGDPFYVSASETNCPVLDPTPPDSTKPYLCFDRFTYAGTDLDAAGTWTNLAPVAGNRCGQAAGNAALNGDIEMLVFEKFSAAKLRVECIDTATKTVFLTGPSNFGLDVGGFIDDHRYLVENVKEALTEPGQWFLDRSVSPWTLVYLAHEAEDPNADAVIIPQQTHVLQASTLSYTTFQGLSFEHDNYVVPDLGQPGDETFKKSTPAVSLTNSNNITFDGVTVARTGGFGIWFTVCLQKQQGAFVVNAGGNPSWCPVGGYSLAPSVTNNIIRNSAFFDLGTSAIGIGFQQRADKSDTDANVPQSFTIENNVIAGYGRVLPNAFGTYQGTAHDITYTHNDVYDGYRVAFHICPCNRNFQGPDSQGAYNNVISYNHVHDLMQGIMNDGGAIRILSGFPGFQAPGNKILNNVVHDINDASAIGDADGYGGDGIYIDDGTSNIEVAYNLVYRVTRAALNITQNADEPGYESDIHDNVFAYARLAMIQNNRPYPNGTAPTPDPIRVFSARNNIFYFTRSGTSSPAFYVQGGCAYSGGYEFEDFQLRENNLYWRTDGTFASDATAFRHQPTKGVDGINTICNSGTPDPGTPGYPLFLTHTFVDFAGWQAFVEGNGVGQDAGSTVQDPGFTNPAYPYDDFSLPVGSAGASVVDVNTYAPHLAGRTSATFTPPRVPATFPTATFDPATGF